MNNPNIVPSGLSIRSLTARLRCNPNSVALQHRLMEARLERSIELGLHVSPEDADLLYDYTWTANNSGYVVTPIKVPAGTGNMGRTKSQFGVTLQRLVLSRMLGCQPWEIPADLDADHINEELGKGNCTRDNIQPLTREQNTKKAQRRSKSKSKINLVYAILHSLEEE